MHTPLSILTNDDGIDAPGLAALRAAVDGPVLIVAPAAPMSGCSHTVQTERAIRLERRGPDAWAVHSAPADCVRAAVLAILPELGIPATPERVRVLSGINAGGNLGADIYVSGTVAAAREAAFFDLPAVALSNYRIGSIDWPRATRWARRVLAALAERPHEPGRFWNANFPALAPEAPEPAVVCCPCSTDPLPVKYARTVDGLQYVRGTYHERRRTPGTDVDVCFGGQIALTQMAL